MVTGRVDSLEQTVRTLIERDGRYPPVPTDERPDKDMALAALAELAALAAAWTAYQEALAALKKEEEE